MLLPDILEIIIYTSIGSHVYIFRCYYLSEKLFYNDYFKKFHKCIVRLYNPFLTEPVDFSKPVIYKIPRSN